MEIVLLFLGVVVVAALALAGLVAGLTLRASKAQRRRLPDSDDDRTPLERAQDAVAQLSDDDRVRLRRWLDAWGPQPPHTGPGDGVLRG